MNLSIYIPAGHAQAWHKVLVQALISRGHDVAAESVRAPGPPLAVRVLAGLECLIFGAGVLGQRVDAMSVASRNTAAPDLVIDLTGALSGAGEPRTLALTFDGSSDPDALIGALLAGRSPVMAVRRSDGAVLASSYPALDDREVLARAMETAYARMIALLVRAVERQKTGATAETWSEPAPTHTPSSASVLAVLNFAFNEAATKLWRQVEKRQSREGQWSLAGRRASGSTSRPALSGEAFETIAAGPDTWADPFIHERNGQAVLFAEWQPAATGIGVIVCARQTEDGGWGPFETCLQRPYHLSYPFVFDHDGETWMMPETGAARTLELYRAVDYPTRWVLDRVVMRDMALADATLVEWEGRWWLFAAKGEFGGSVMDELFAWHAASPLGPWTPHALSPLKSDARVARPAGRFIVSEGRLYRPAQDCEAGYGAGLVWCEVTELTPMTFSERVVDRWRGSDLGAEGVHAFERGGGVEVIDLKKARRRPGQAVRAARS